MAKTEILFHKDELKSTGIEIISLEGLEFKDKVPHRDDHFMLIIQIKGNFVLEIDFREVILSGSSLCYIAPGQVHQYREQENNEGWIVFLETALVAKAYLEVLNTSLNSHQFSEISPDDLIFNFIPVFKSMLTMQAETFTDSIITSLTDSLLGIFVQNLMQNRKAKNLIGGQKYKTVIEFKHLVQQHYKKLKQVKEYSEILNITPLYLNEIVKEITGFSASHWIHEEIILEAQRLLYYTDLDIKQIAYQLGYDDHAYFSRFFKKNTGNTASQFRIKKTLFVQ
ncbi:helix-turn-helix domain-containing protein [Chryseobacterium taeanense]|uniref:helix-turn-helix domain-containing protein n=1 Tax=Chryseobacterium taeanense TaxID=311334 RepID=UPI0035AF8D58